MLSSFEIKIRKFFVQKWYASAYIDESRYVLFCFVLARACHSKVAS